jgi:hypothetical protein
MLFPELKVIVSGIFGVENQVWINFFGVEIKLGLNFCV